MPDKWMTKGYHRILGMSTEPISISQWVKSSCYISRMKKDTRLTFRVNSSLKKEVERIAAREEVSVARICEAFLLAGSDLYKRKGSRLLQHLIGRLNIKSVQ